MKIRVLHLYDQYLNIYADRGNIAVLQARCAWRGIECEVRGLAPGERFDPADVDLVYVGGGQDRDQAMIAEHMARDLREPLHEGVADGLAVLAVCGGYQLLGASYLDTNRVLQPGVELFDLRTEAGATRMIGNVAIECTLPAVGVFGEQELVIAGFENHAGRTLLGEAATPLGKVLHGYGNDGRSGFEGCRRDRAVGTYLHGPLLPRNPGLADWLIAGALVHGHGEEAAARVTPLEDPLAALARRTSLERARGERRVSIKAPAGAG